MKQIKTLVPSTTTHICMHKWTDIRKEMVTFLGVILTSRIIKLIEYNQK